MVQSGTGPQGPRRQREPDDGDRAGATPATDDAVIALLAELAPLTAPDRAERDRMRERVLAGLNRPSPVPRTPSPRPARAGRAPRGRRAAGAATRPGDEPRAKGYGARGRFAIASVAVLALVFSLAGMSLLLARDALPGDPLYGVKRTGEAASLGLTFGDEGRGFKLLEFATDRVGELETLAQAYADPANAPLGAYLSALADFDQDAAAGSRSLTEVAAAGRDGALLGTLRDWAGHQRVRLGTLRAPAAALTPQAVSLALLGRIDDRAAALSGRLACAQVTSGALDELGPLPATTACAPAPVATSPLGVPSPAPTATAPGPGTAPGRTAGGPTTPGGPEPSPRATGTPTPPSAPTTTPPPTTTTGPNALPPLPLPPIEVPPLLPGLPD
ncbi:DUF5667 domain-containing protein [Actinokineospora sp. 24-640]